MSDQKELFGNPLEVTDKDRRVRGSETGRCQRMRVLKLSAPLDEPDLETRGIWRRGEQVEEAAVDDLRASYAHRIDAGEVDFYEQYQIDSPYGPAHPDVVVEDNEGAVVWEIKSGTGGLDVRHVWQLRFYMWAYMLDNHWTFGRVSGVVRIVSPLNLLYQDYPVALEEKHVEFLVNDNDEVLAMASEGTVPDRVCAHPQDGPARFCPVVSACFKDWEPEEVGVLPAAMREAAQELAQLQQDKSENSKDARSRDGKIRELQAAFREVLSPGQMYVSDAVVVKVGKETTRRTFRQAEAAKAGVWTAEDDERFAPFFGESTSSTVKASPSEE